MRYLRWAKLILVVQVGLFATLVAFNNVVDYDSNFAFVQHVLSMDTTFDGNTLMWRAIDNILLHHLFYWIIITSETLVGALCIWGAWVLLKHINADSLTFNLKKQVSTWGLLCGICLWSTGFMTVGGEWFVMWQSDIWNGQEAAFRFIMIIFATLIFLHFPEVESTQFGSKETE